MKPVVRKGIVAAAHVSIRRGSRSFAAASRLFDQATREHVWLLYAWCRACDDLTDAQDHGGAPGDPSRSHKRIAAIRMLTARAMSGELTGNPAFDALRILARETALTPDMTDDVLAGFELDATGWRPRTEADLLRYCYHVAGAVGVMMAIVMGVSRSDDEMLDRACDLGVAFQLANIARDVWQDDAAGRCYLPMDWLAAADIPPGEVTKPHYRGALVPLVARLCDLAEQYQASARVGAARLPFRQRWAVLSAAGIYGAIAKDVRRKGEHAWDHRIHTTRARRIALAGRAFLQSWLKPKPAEQPVLSRRELSAMTQSGR